MCSALLSAPSPVERIASLACGERMKKALGLVADGLPYRDAAKEVGYRDHREVYRWAKRAKLLEVHSEQLVAAYKRISSLSNAELERRLTENPEAIATRDLAIIGGIAADKAAKFENWGKAQESDRPNPVLLMLERIQEMTQAGHEFKLEVARPKTEIRALDAGRD